MPLTVGMARRQLEEMLERGEVFPASGGLVELEEGLA
jgi:hypothetical protein